MNKKLSILVITALIASSTFSHASFKETALGFIKRHPAVFSTIGFAATLACFYKSNEYQKESDRWDTYVANLTDADKKLINDCIRTPLNENKSINISGKLYKKIYDAHMEERTKTKLKTFIQRYNELLEEGPESEEFNEIKGGLSGLIHYLNNRQDAINHRDKLEKYADNYYMATTACCVASLIPLAIDFYINGFKKTA